MTIREVLEQTINLLNGIKVDVKDTESIAMPIMGAVRNIRICTDVMDQAQKEAEQKEAEQEAPENVIEMREEKTDGE